MIESQKYKIIGGWWKPTRGHNNDPREIDIVAVALDGKPYAFEVKRKREKYNASELDSQTRDLSNKIFGGRPVDFACLTLEDM